MKPLLSIVFPTRNRSQYLIDSVRLTLREIADCEVIIADNSDDDALGRELNNQFDDNRIIYSHSPEILSVVDNFERAVDLAEGKFLIFLGDDDSIGPGLVDIASWADSNGIDAVISYREQFLCSYYWPGIKSKYFGDQYAGNVFVSEFTGAAYPLDAIASLKKVAANPSGGLGAMPRAYHGLVSRVLVEKIRNKYGSLFGGVSPDIYSATLIADMATKSFVVDFPFVIPGASPSSTAGQGALRSDRGDLKTVEHITRFGTDFNWDMRLPAFYSPHTVWPYSLLKAIERVKRDDVIFSFANVYAQCLAKDRKYTKKIIAAIDATFAGMNKVLVYLTILGHVAKIFATLAVKIARRLANPRAGGSATKYSGCSTISKAYEKVTEHVRENKIQLVLDKV